MSHESHKAHAPRHVRVFILTVSDTRTEATDRGGALCRQLCTEAGHEITGAGLVRDEPALVEAAIRGVAEQGSADVVIATGGTGLSRRDNTYEAVSRLLDKRMDGFGELFRMLSYAEIGAAAMLSRAVAGLHRQIVVFALPGSVNAVRLGLERLILPELGHVVSEAHR